MKSPPLPKTQASPARGAGRESPPSPRPVEPAAWCAAEVQRHDADRFACVLAAPAADRPGLFALYALNLELARTREMVSEPMLGEIRLQWWRDGVEEVFRGAPKQHPVLLALAACHGRTPLSRAHLDALIEARVPDLYDEQVRGVHELLGYAAGTSARLVHLALEALGTADLAAHAAGEHVGIAWALAGLLRAVPFHAAQRRLYLPLGMLASAGLDAEDVYRARRSPALSEIVAEIAGLARGRLVEARALARAVPTRALPALLPAVLAERYLDRLAACRFDPFAAPVQLGPVERPLLLMRANLRRRY